MNIYEIRKFIKADNIVDAMNKDTQTPPSFLALVDEEEEELVGPIGFQENKE